MRACWQTTQQQFRRRRDLTEWSLASRVGTRPACEPCGTNRAPLRQKLFRQSSGCGIRAMDFQDEYCEQTGRGL